MQLFGGEVRIADLALERPFGVAPSLAANLRFDGIDLAPLTGAFGFGEITGRLNGRLLGLRLVDWTPVAFDARLLSDRTYDEPAEAEFAAARRTPQPLRTFTERVHLPQPLEHYRFGRTYIKALGDPRKADAPDAFWDAADRYREHPAWQYRELTSNHMIPQNQPAELVGILLDLA